MEKNNQIVATVVYFSLFFHHIYSSENSFQPNILLKQEAEFFPLYSIPTNKKRKTPSPPNNSSQIYQVKQTEAPTLVSQLKEQIDKLHESLKFSHINQQEPCLVLHLSDIENNKLSTMQKNLPTIQNISIISNNQPIATTHIELLAKTFPHIQYLNLANTGLTWETASTLAQQEFKQLKHLDISHNELNSLGFFKLCQASFISQLTTIYATNNNIEVIWDDIANLQTLQILDLSNNPLNPTAYTLLWKKLPKGILLTLTT